MDRVLGDLREKFSRERSGQSVSAKVVCTVCQTKLITKNKTIKVIRIRPLAPVQHSVSLKLVLRKTLNFVIKFTRCRKYNQMT